MTDSALESRIDRVRVGIKTYIILYNVTRELTLMKSLSSKTNIIKHTVLNVSMIKIPVQLLWTGVL